MPVSQTGAVAPRWSVSGIIVIPGRSIGHLYSAASRGLLALSGRASGRCDAAPEL